MIPNPNDFPRGVMVLSTDGTDRTRLRWGAGILAVILFGLGFGTGWAMKKRRGRRGNPRRRR